MILCPVCWFCCWCPGKPCHQTCKRACPCLCWCCCESKGAKQVAQQKKSTPKPKKSDEGSGDDEEKKKKKKSKKKRAKKASGSDSSSHSEREEPRSPKESHHSEEEEERDAPAEPFTIGQFTCDKESQSWETRNPNDDYEDVFTGCTVSGSNDWAHGHNRLTAPGGSSIKVYYRVPVDEIREKYGKV